MILEEDFSIIGVTETWLNSEYPSKFVSIPNYNILRTDRDSRGGGVACYLKANYKFRHLHSSNAGNALEQLWLVINFNKQKIALGVIYRPPSSNIETCLSELYSVLERAYLEADLVIFMGDININLLNVDSAGSKYFNNLLGDFDLCQIIRNPTRITENSESLIDVICVSRSVVVNSSDTMDMHGISDHMLVLCEVYIE